MNLAKLAEPFKESEIEWRLARADKKGNGQIWAMCLAYIQARAVMGRLDEVCGPENWSISYSFVEKGVIAKLSINVNGSWVTKEDGAEMTEVEPFKGGISSALKRVGAVWGIGRYLYGLESTFARVVPQGTQGELYGRTKDGSSFYWVPPALPQWALPKGEISKALPKVYPEKPSIDDGVPSSSFGAGAKRAASSGVVVVKPKDKGYAVEKEPELDIEEPGFENFGRL